MAQAQGCEDPNSKRGIYSVPIYAIQVTFLHAFVCCFSLSMHGSIQSALILPLRWQLLNTYSYRIVGSSLNSSPLRHHHHPHLYPFLRQGMVPHTHPRVQYPVRTFSTR
jgi:hypothetical protein